MICLSLEKFLISIPFHKVGKNIKDFLLWFASPKTFPKIPKTIPWPWPQLVAIYTPLIHILTKKYADYPGESVRFSKIVGPPNVYTFGKNS